MCFFGPLIWAKSCLYSCGFDASMPGPPSIQAQTIQGAPTRAAVIRHNVEDIVNAPK